MLYPTISTHMYRAKIAVTEFLALFTRIGNPNPYAYAVVASYKCSCGVTHEGVTETLLLKSNAISNGRLNVLLDYRPGFIPPDHILEHIGHRVEKGEYSIRRGTLSAIHGLIKKYDKDLNELKNRANKYMMKSTVEALSGFQARMYGDERDPQLRDAENAVGSSSPYGMMISGGGK